MTVNHASTTKQDWHPSSCSRVIRNELFHVPGRNVSSRIYYELMHELIESRRSEGKAKMSMIHLQTILVVW